MLDQCDGKVHKVNSVFVRLPRLREAKVIQAVKNESDKKFIDCSGVNLGLEQQHFG